MRGKERRLKEAGPRRNDRATPICSPGGCALIQSLESRGVGG